MVEKGMVKNLRWDRQITPYRASQGGYKVPRRCYYCNKSGQLWAKCLARKAAEKGQGPSFGPGKLQ